jgi:hypothetical protein
MLLFPIAVESGVDVGALAAQCLVELGMTHKECWIVCGYGDGAQWHRALKGEAPLDLWRLRHLSIKWWQLFLPRLASALIQQFFSDLSVPYRMARASVDEHEQQQQQKRSA